MAYSQNPLTLKFLLILQIFHIFHVFDYHQRDLEGDGILETRRSSPVLFCNLSRRYTRVFLWIYSCLEVSETFRLFSKNLLMVVSVSSSKSSGDLPSKISRIKHLAQRNGQLINQTADSQRAVGDNVFSR